ncbi:MAG: T9SS type A sorting domain-containing protein [Bacteroidales bacterium]|nr:T9SS type A sorting domain-containing protein [Bacteroidales bacterium]
MMNNTKIIVNRGGKLILDGGTVTNTCGGYWQGIELHGNTQEPQEPQYQGVVQIQNGGTISNAECGIKTFKPLDQGDDSPPDQMFAGGIIWANDANFVNNITAVEFLPYDTRSVSAFTECTFETNSNALTEFVPKEFVKITGIDGVAEKDLTFKNTKNSGMPTEENGNGIYATNAQLWINHVCIDQANPCQTYQRNIFDNLHYGIYSRDIGYNKLVQIKNSDFTNNLKGVYIGDNASGIEVLSNDFELTYPAGDQCYGLYLDYCTGYHVEDNDMYCNQTGKQGIGMYINFSGTEDNMIYRNNLTNLEYGIVTLNVNRRRQEGGLCVKCNNFTGNMSDLSVKLSSGVTSPDHGIAHHQGTMDPSDDAPAGNIFSDFPEHEWDIFNEGQDISYVYHNLNSTDEKIEPTLISPNVSTAENRDAYLNEYACPSMIDPGGTLDEQRSLMASADSSIDSVNEQLSLTVDGGDTEDLNTDVVMSTPPESLQTRDQLLNESPYLSDTVMKSAINKEEVLPNAMIRDVLVANPQSAKNNEVLSELDNRFDPMPVYMMTQIMDGKDSIGPKERIEAERFYYFQEHARGLNKLIRLFKQDSLINPEDSLVTLYTDHFTLKNGYRKAFALLRKGDTANMNATFTAIQDTFDLTAAQQAIHLNYQLITTILNQLNEDTLMIFNVDSATIAQLLNISANDGGMPGQYATSLLLALGETTYSEPIYLPAQLQSGEIYDEQLPYDAVEEYYLEVYPNPANDYIIIKYKLPEAARSKRIMINGLNGQQVFAKQLDGYVNEIVVPIKDFNSGTYIVSLHYNGTVQESKKLAIIH